MNANSLSGQCRAQTAACQGSDVLHLLSGNGMVSQCLCSELCLGKKGEGVSSVEDSAPRFVFWLHWVCLQRDGFSSVEVVAHPG